MSMSLLWLPPRQRLTLLILTMLITHKEQQEQTKKITVVANNNLRTEIILLPEQNQTVFQTCLCRERNISYGVNTHTAIVNAKRN